MLTPATDEQLLDEIETDGTMEAHCAARSEILRRLARVRKLEEALRPFAEGLYRRGGTPTEGDILKDRAVLED